MRTSNHHGFTLIELSIVLVIIGLIVGGILVGGDLIRVAELRGDIREIEKIDSAVNTFRLKYNCLPGDCVNATQFLEGAYNGNGNGLIETWYTDHLDVLATSGAFITYEVAYAIDDLARAKLIAVTPFDANDAVAVDVDSAMPSLPYGGSFVVLPEFISAGGQFILTGKHMYRLGTRGQAAGLVSTLPARFTPSDAFYIDSKMDDGSAVAGRVTAAASNAWPNDAPFLPISVLIGNCAPAGPSLGLTPDSCEYNVTVTDTITGLFVRATF